MVVNGQRYALLLELAGTHYAGTAIQPAPIPTLHRHLAECLDQLCPGTAASLQCCSRLDAGVAASCFTVHCDLNQNWSPTKLVQALNGLLRWPDHQRHASCLAAAAVAADWDAWRSARSKTYRYRILCSGAPPLHQQHCLWLRRQPRHDILQQAAHLFLGQHDLSGFACLRGDASDLWSPQRHILRSQWEFDEDQRGQWLTYEVCGTGFLYKQVRGMVGAMLSIASRDGESLISFSAAIAAGRQASRVGDVAPAKGLTLSAIDYGQAQPNWQHPA